MKQPVTLRLDPQLLAEAKRAAKIENRTLTNFIETLMKEHISPKHSKIVDNGNIGTRGSAAWPAEGRTNAEDE